MSRACARELPPLEVAAARGCRRCLGLLLRGQEPLAPQSGRSRAQEPRWPRRSLSFLTEDGSDDSDTGVAFGDIPEAGVLSSTRRSLLDGPGDTAVPWVWPDCPHEPRGDTAVPWVWPDCPHEPRGDTAVPWVWPDCPQEPRGDTAVPWVWPDCPQEPRGDTAVPLPPLASSTLLWDRDHPQEPPPRRVLGTRTRGPPGASLGDIAVPCPRFAGGVSPRQHPGGVLGTRAVSPRSPPPRGGFSGRSVAPQSSGDTAGDIPWGRAAVPDTEVTETGDPAGLGDSGTFGDSTESFVTARESLGGAPAPGDLGLDLGLGRDFGQDLDLGRDLRQDLGLGQGLGQDLGQDLEQNLGLGRDLGQDFGQDLGLGREGSGAAPQIPASPRAVGALLARLGGCSLGGSPPRSPRGPGSPGGVTPRGCDILGDRHVTPRSRSRLRAVAARICSSSSSSSSSSFPETLPMSPRVPRVAVTSPPGRCVTAGDRDVSPVDGEGTGGSQGDTQAVPGLSPRGGSVPKPGPRVLRGLGDKGHRQNCSGSQPRGLGDKGHPQTSLSPARGSPRGSARLRPLPGNRRHPRKSPCVTRGVPSATSSPEPEGGSGWQRPSPLGTPAVPLSPCGDLGTPSVPLSPGCATRRAESHQEDVTQELAPRECHSPGGGTGATSGPGRGGRAALGDNPGPVTAWGQRGWPQGHSPELLAALRTGHIPDCAQDELALTGHFERPEHGQPWPGGRLKSSFNYLLLDPRVTRDLPRRSPGLSPAEQFRTFVTAVFYVGKGTRARPWWHLHQALAQHRRGTHRGGPKVRRILEIWAGGQGVVPLQCFQHRVPAEALTRESCMLEALGLQALTNARRGPCYGVAAAWPGPRRRRLGVLLLHRAMGVLLAEGERQIRPGDIPGPP